jgi:hypothetical protein
MNERWKTQFYRVFLLPVALLALYSCGSNVVLDDYRQGAKNDCATQPSASDYQACIDAVDRSYEDYKNDKNTS